MSATDDGRLRTFSTGATRDTAEDKFDPEGFISPEVWWRFSKYMHKHRQQSDGSLRDSDNWQKGIPRKQYLKSLLRHVFDLWLLFRNKPPRFDPNGTDIQDVLCAILFNTQGLLHEVINGRDV